MSEDFTTDTSFSAASAEADRWQAEVARLVRIDGDSVVINSQEYTVHKSYCDTHAKILWWALHLAGKPWATTIMIDRFVRSACRVNGLPLPPYSG